MAYRVSRNASDDLEDIFLYWAQAAGLPVADRLIDSITERFWMLDEYPDAGPACEDMAPGVRCFPAGNYLIYYRRIRKRVDILHVFHSALNRNKAFRRRAKRCKAASANMRMPEYF